MMPTPPRRTDDLKIAALLVVGVAIVAAVSHALYFWMIR